VGQQQVTFTEAAHTSASGRSIGPRALVTQVEYPLAASSASRPPDLAHLPPGRPGDVAVPRPGHAAGIVAVPAGQPERVAGVARYERTAADTARILVFADAFWRRAGLGTLLLSRLAEAARHAGVRRLAGDVPRSDVAMLGLLEELGLGYEEQVTAASVHASFAVEDTGAYLDALLADQREAARVSVAPFLCPRSIAPAGASDKPGISALVLANLLASGFTGPVYPVNPRHRRRGQHRAVRADTAPARGAEEIDAIIAVFIPIGGTPAEDFAREIAAAAGLPGKPVIAVFMTAGPAPASLSGAGIPVFTRPEQAATALGRIARWAEWRARPAGHIVTPPGIDPGRGRAVIDAMLASQPGGGWADTPEVGSFIVSRGRCRRGIKQLAGHPRPAGGERLSPGARGLESLAGYKERGVNDGDEGH